MGLRGLVFFDIGKGFNSFDSEFPMFPLRASVGLGIRWLTPMGPLKMDYGFNLSPEDDESSSRFHFFVGGTF
jgi:outer membrane protein insertion porin family